MFPHISPPTPGPVESHASYEAQQRILSQWLVAQPAYEVTTSALRSRNTAFSPDQIDAILAIRKRIASTQKSHD